MAKKTPDPELLPIVRMGGDIIYKTIKFYSFDEPHTAFNGNTGRGVTPQQLAKVLHLEWVPTDILDFCRTYNGVTIIWDADTKSELTLRGEIRIKPLEIMFHDWEGEIYWRKHLTPKDAHMEHFKVVDDYSGDAVVGLFHTAARDPELYYFDREDIYRLYIDFAGYLALLTHTLGCAGWLELVRALGPATPDNRPFRPASSTEQEILERLQAAVPGFDLAAFVACYDQVRLPTPPVA